MVGVHQQNITTNPQCGDCLISLLSHRYQTLQQWPNNYPRKKRLAEAGFYCNADNKIECFLCHLEVSLATTDDPLALHWIKYPHCSHLKEIRGNVGLGPISMKNAPFEIRVGTFQAWPYQVESIEDLAMAGFYYAGPRDQTHCYYCGVKLHEWKMENNPWQEHAHHSPKCPHVIQMKGLSYVLDQSSHIPCTRIIVDQICPILLDDNLEESRTCVVCFSRRSDIAYPCGHLATCISCSFKLSKCPICRKEATDSEKIHVHLPETLMLAEHLEMPNARNVRRRGM